MLGKLLRSTSQPSWRARTGNAGVLHRVPSERPAGAEAAFSPVSRNGKTPRSREQGHWSFRDVSKVSGVGAVGSVLEVPLSQ